MPLPYTTFLACARARTPFREKKCIALAGAVRRLSIAGKSPEEIRRTFNIKNDFTPEEEAQVREENKWCEEL